MWQWLLHVSCFFFFGHFSFGISPPWSSWPVLCGTDTIVVFCCCEWKAHVFLAVLCGAISLTLSCSVVWVVSLFFLAVLCGTVMRLSSAIIVSQISPLILAGSIVSWALILVWVQPSLLGFFESGSPTILVWQYCAGIFMHFLCVIISWVYSNSFFLAVLMRKSNLAESFWQCCYILLWGWFLRVRHCFHYIGITSFCCCCCFRLLFVFSWHKVSSLLQKSWERYVLEISSLFLSSKNSWTDCNLGEEA